MRRLAFAGTALLTAVLLPLSFNARPTLAATTTWVATATKAEAPALVNATLAGALPASTAMHISVALPMHNQSNIQQYLKATSTAGNPLFGQTLTPAEFAAEYGANSVQVHAVEPYLTAQGFRNVQAQPNNLLITADCTAAEAATAFNTQISQFTQGGRTIFANVSDAKVPAALSGDVAAVLGLTNAGKMVHPPTIPSPTGYLKSYNPSGFWNAYDGLITTGHLTNIAIFAEGNLAGPINDLKVMEQANHLVAVPVSVVPVGIASTDIAGADEWDMDTQFSTGMAGYVNHLYIYDATSLTDSDLALEFSKFATDNVAKAGSASFGECEHQAYLDGSMVADDMYFAEAALQGQTVFASAGDTGGFCPVAPTNGVPGGVPLPNYPASSPYVVSVGGTSLFTNADNSYQSEIAWTGAVVDPADSSTSRTGRTA